ncbi:MAG: hypothetical protein V2A71_07375 [Candidatus Eisenbacteria bacterium]
MKKLLVLISALFLMAPVVAFAGNANPHLYLEVYNFEEDPEGGLPPMPGYICVHTEKPCLALHCYDVKVPYNFGVVPVHVGKLDLPICETFGLPCKEPVPLGGFLGISIGVVRTGEVVTFQTFTSCPGFLTGPSQAGMPAAILTSSTSGCHDWVDHPGYLYYLNMSTRTGATYFDIVASVDTGLFKLINCHNEYDDGTAIGGRGQWGGSQTIICYGFPTTVDETTWGKIKGLYR